MAMVPEEGSVHVRAETKAQALKAARKLEEFQWEDVGVPLELKAAPVTAEEHAKWEASDAWQWEAIDA
jgi:hypothetical protein